MLPLAAIVAWLAITTLTFTVGAQVTWKRRQVLNRLQLVVSMAPANRLEDIELSRPISERVWKPLFRKLAELVGRLAPQSWKARAAEKLTMAGNPWNMDPASFIAVQLFFTVLVPLGIIGFGMACGSPFAQLMMPAGEIAGAGYILPGFLLSRKAKTRQAEIESSLPDVLDILSVSVEAGLGFDAAMVKIVDKLKGTLPEEFRRVLQETRMGKPRRDALRDLAKRSGCPDLQAFISALIQADQLGVSIGHVLRIQSEGMRLKRRQRAEESAMKAPIKMLFPLIIFIFPVIFIVLLGPAMIRIITSLTGGLI